MKSINDRKVITAISEISEAMRDAASVLNAVEGEHRTMKLSGVIIGIERALGRIRETLDYGAKPVEPTEAVVEQAA